MSLALTLARRELRGGLRGLRLLAVCLFLGVAALAGVGSLTAAVVGGLAAQGREILGGDIEVTVSQRVLTPAERAVLTRLGRVSESAKLRGMAARLDGAQAVLAEVKSVDRAYPLVGRLAPAMRRDGSVLIAPALAERLALAPGDRLRLGEATPRVAGLIAAEPDRVGEGFAFGPTVLVDPETLAASGLVQPGSLYQWRYRVALAQGGDVGAIAERLRHDHPDWRVQDSRNGAPGTRRFIERIGQFLGLVGLTALAVAGIGVGNGVAAYLDARRPGIATLKALGASSGTIARTYALAVLLVAGGAVLAALAVGALVPWVVGHAVGSLLPVPPRLALYPAPLLLAAAQGLLVAAAFALPPLAQARAVSAASLFRGAVDAPPRPPRIVLALAGLLLLGVAGLAVATAREPMLAAGFVAGVAALLAVLGLLARAIRALAARAPRPRRPLLRLALANLHAPGAQTGRLVVALGLGLSLFATLAVVQTSLANQLRTSVPETAPGFFVLDVPGAEIGRFRALVRAQGAADLVTVPSLRGPVVALNGTRVADMKDLPEGAWFLRGDRGLTFAAELPRANRITAGRWWPAGYAGPPLVSMDAEAGRLLGLKIGDRLTVSALGVEIEARIASFREIDWDSLGFNFVLIFSPGTFDGAPFTYMATLDVPPARERAFNRAISAAFPSVSLIRVREVVESVAALLGQLSAAVAVAAAVVVASGIAVLVGAIAAARAQRLYDAVLLKLLGATRAQVLAAQAIEQALVAALLGVVALAVGTGAGWYVATRVLGLGFAPDWHVVALTVGGGASGTLLIGLVGALPALAARPAQALRSL